MRPFRDNYKTAIRQFVGSHYSENGADERVPVNMLELAVSIYVQQMAASAPNVMCSTKYAELKPAAADFGIVMNYELQRMMFEQTMQEAVMAALFSPFAVVKFGEAEGRSVEYMGHTHRAGAVFCDLVDLDDLVIDMSAKRWSATRYIGDRYRLPLEAVHDGENFDRRYRDRVSAVSRHTRSESDFDLEDDEHSSTIARGEQHTDDGEVEEYTELWDLWLPAEGVIVTIPGVGEPIPLRVVEWDGAETGPYDRLHFQDVPGNLMPLPPVALWMDLHDLGNRLFRKLASQSLRQKTVYGVRAAAAADGERTVSANDGDMIKVDSDVAKPRVFPGADANSMAMFLQTKDLFTYLGGNLDMLGGLSPQAQTLGQDQLLAQNASQRVVKMQKATVSFARRIVKGMAHYVWTNPLADYQLEKRVPGADIGVQVNFTADSRKGEFPQYDIDIEPFSMQHQTPGMKLQALTEAFNTFVGPYMEMMMQQGIAVNFAETLRTVSRLANLPELEDVLTFVEPQVDAPQSISSRGGGKPRNTTRRYERVNRPGGTRAGRDAALSKLLMGGPGAVNASEAVSLDGGVR